MTAARYRFLSEPWVAQLDRVLAHQRFAGAAKGFVVEIECTNTSGLPSDLVHFDIDTERVRIAYGPAPAARRDARVVVDRAVAEALWTEQDPTFATLVYGAGMIRSDGSPDALTHLRDLLISGAKEAMVAAMEPFTEPSRPGPARVRAEAGRRREATEDPSGGG
ncbi:hypothetical protein BH24ACT3_BH24ACT3_03650 [soil metagenome]